MSDSALRYGGRELRDIALALAGDAGLFMVGDEALAEMVETLQVYMDCAIETARMAERNAVLALWDDTPAARWDEFGFMVERGEHVKGGGG